MLATACGVLYGRAVAVAGSAHPGVAWPFFVVARKLGLPVDAGLEVVGMASGRPPAEARIGPAQANDLPQMFERDDMLAP